MNGGAAMALETNNEAIRQARLIAAWYRDFADKLQHFAADSLTMAQRIEPFMRRTLDGKGVNPDEARTYYCHLASIIEGLRQCDRLVDEMESEAPWLDGHEESWITDDEYKT